MHVEISENRNKYTNVFKEYYIRIYTCMYTYAFDLDTLKRKKLISCKDPEENIFIMSPYETKIKTNIKTK